MGDLALEAYNLENATTVLSARSRDDGSFGDARLWTGSSVLSVVAEGPLSTRISALNGLNAAGGQGIGSIGVRAYGYTGVMGVGQGTGVFGTTTTPGNFQGGLRSTRFIHL